MMVVDNQDVNKMTLRNGKSRLFFLKQISNFSTVSLEHL